jgi:hypothetical protein
MLRNAAVFLALTSLVPPGTSQGLYEMVLMESSRTRTTRPVIRGTAYAVSSMEPLATKAAERILNSGGNAFDAAVARQFVLNNRTCRRPGPHADRSMRRRAGASCHSSFPRLPIVRIRLRPIVPGAPGCSFLFDQIEQYARIEIAAPRAIIIPPLGVRPIVVSTGLPSRTAARLAPFPRWAITTAPFASSPRLLTTKS